MSKKNTDTPTSGIDADADAQTVLAEAEAIRRGEDPTTTSGVPSSAGTSDAPGNSAGPPAESPAEFSQLASLAVALSDALLVRAFGKGSELEEPLRAEALKAWAAVIAQYVPMLQQAGPLGALGGIYLAHALLCYSKNEWTSAPSPASSANVEAAKPLS